MPILQQVLKLNLNLEDEIKFPMQRLNDMEHARKRFAEKNEFLLY